MRFGQVGFAQQGTGHGDEGEALGQRHLDGGQFRDAAEEDERAWRARAGTGGRRGGRTPPRRDRTCRKRWPTKRKPRRTGPGSVAPNSCSGASPRNRYIGLASELPPVSSSASSAPSASNERGHLDAVVEPQATVDAVGHVELGRHRHVRAGAASRTVRSTVRAKRARFSTDPPNWSSRRLSLGLKKALRR